MIEFLVAGLFTDHMVLQQKRANPVWGWDQPGQVISLSVEGAPSAVQTVSVTVGADGTWRLQCPELPAGGPYRLHIKGSAGEKVIDDVKVGEVWLAGGQSNMEWGLFNTEGGPTEAALPENPDIRCFKVPRQVALAAQKDVAGSWQTANPGARGSMTAIGYYYAKKLNAELHVPVGIISDNWGGTRVEAWVSEQGLDKSMDVKADQEALEAQYAKVPEQEVVFAEKVREWETKYMPKDPGNAGEAKGWALPSFDDSQWGKLQVPGIWQTQGIPESGAVWLRRGVEIPADLQGADLVLGLGLINNCDTTYFNGEKVGEIPSGTPLADSRKRSYVIPGRLVKAGRAVIAVRVYNPLGEGGITGPVTEMGLRPAAKTGGPLRISGEWRAKLEAAVVAGTVDWSVHPWPSYPQPQQRLASLYNGMIAPVEGYGMRGVIWYQGESNVDKASAYGARFRSLIRDWRGRWGQGDFPVYFVQLANFKDSISWAVLREQQEQTLSEPGTGMAVIIDAGNPADIHPKNKVVVGERLARIALSDTYGVAGIETSGPVRARVSISGAEVHVSFTHAQGLRTKGGVAEVKGFELAGADGVFHAAAARVQGEAVVVSSAGVAKPVHVRYAFADAPETNLENAAGLPARPFRTDGL